MRKLAPLIILLLFTCSTSYSQAMRSLEQLINKEEPGWDLVQQWIKEAKNKVEVLPKDTARANAELLQAQVTTRSPMGAIIYETGGILVHDGWLRILGSGSAKLNRGLIEWNKSKSINKLGEQPPFLLIADDAIGGFFAINAGQFSDTDLGKVFYLSPDNLKWEPLGLSYSDFIVFCFSGDLKEFYKDLQWKNWQKEVRALDGNQAFHFYPYLFTKEGKNIEKVSRKAVPVEELWTLYNQMLLELP